jgi:hypothetical protein
MKDNFLSVSIFVLAIVLANISTAYFGPKAIPVNAFLLIGLDLSLRDKLHDRWDGNRLWLKMFTMISLGGYLSFLTCRDSEVIAVASCVAFTASSFGDAITYHIFRTAPYAYRVNISNAVGAAVDSALFPLLAFGSYAPGVVVGQFVAKTLGGGVWSMILPLMLKGFFYGHPQSPRIQDNSNPRKSRRHAH